MALSMHHQRHIEAWQSSSLSQAAYCREHGLNSKTFGNWLRIYRAEQLDSQASAAMIPVNIKPAISSKPAHYIYTGLAVIPCNYRLMFRRNGWANC